MKYFKLKFADGSSKVVRGKCMLEIINKYDLASDRHKDTRIFELYGEQRALAQADYED